MSGFLKNIGVSFEVRSPTIDTHIRLDQFKLCSFENSQRSEIIRGTVMRQPMGSNFIQMSACLDHGTSTLA